MPRSLFSPNKTTCSDSVNQPPYPFIAKPMPFVVVIPQPAWHFKAVSIEEQVVSSQVQPEIRL